MCDHLWDRSSVCQYFAPEYERIGFLRKKFITWHFVREEDYYCQKCTEPKRVTKTASGESIPSWWSSSDPCSGTMTSGYKLPKGIHGW